MPLSQRLPLGLFGILGSFAPSIIKMFNELPNVAFLFKWEWIVVVALYGLLGGIIAIIYPYKSPPTEWKALLLGCGFPAILGTAVSAAHLAGPGSLLGGPDIQQSWTFWDFVALF